MCQECDNWQAFNWDGIANEWIKDHGPIPDTIICGLCGGTMKRKELNGNRSEQDSQDGYAEQFGQNIKARKGSSKP